MQNNTKNERMKIRTVREHIAAVLVASLALPLGVSSARAETRSALEPEARLWAARTCYVEASFRSDDCVALLWVMHKRAKRAGRPWLDMLRDYSAINADTKRANEARAFPWGDVPAKPDSFNRQWGKLRDLVAEFAEGKLADPCPRAYHWGGTMDPARGRMVRARCAVTTANTFYAVTRPQGVRR